MAPILEEGLIVMIEQGGTAPEAFNSVDGRIDSITTTVVFSYCEPNPYRKIAKKKIKDTLTITLYTCEVEI